MSDKKTIKDIITAQPNLQETDTSCDPAGFFLGIVSSERLDEVKAGATVNSDSVETRVQMIANYTGLPVWLLVSDPDVTTPGQMDG